MEKGTALFLQILIGIVGIGAALFLLWEPHVEGVNVGVPFFQVYTHDYFLWYAYIASIPFFIGLYKIGTVVGLVGQNGRLTQQAAKPLRAIQYCALSIIPLTAIGMLWLLMTESDDRPPIIAMGTIVVIISSVVAIASRKQVRRTRAILGGDSYSPSHT